ncbi:DarT ssDNA thymidine ADP-ribosyltransferase family protein [Sorangium sp. So ce1024]|uniref:DarT ssDNA thymidine ADP-ribosyltransferase family protein n=1 Tax=Sorangium sp. So ce1024 TaxID=3133327 RepID=UPI003F03D8A7
MSTAIRAKVVARKITRLCHFTPSRNLVHIATDPRGILSAASLLDDEKAVLNATDAQRLDGFRDHVCCSVQYPNAWYFRKARKGEPLFIDWVVLLLKPDPLWAAGTKFSARNAAANYGSGVAEGEHAFDSMFKDRVVGARNKTYVRTATHPSWLTTDEQAEVLIPDRVAREDILGVAVANEAQAKREHARLTQLQADVPSLLIVPEFFEDPWWLSAQLRAGRPPTETPYVPGGAS